ncbi:hypothetical protein V2J09_011425 [Rumex salicifolius]
MRNKGCSTAINTNKTPHRILTCTFVLCIKHIRERMRRSSIRALWILNKQDVVIFSRRFPVVERRWRTSCKAEDIATIKEEARSLNSDVPTNSEVADAFVERKKREGSPGGYGIRMAQSVEGSDSWVDDPIVRHIISLQISEEGGECHLLWPLISYTKGPFYILVLPLVEPKHLVAYSRLLNRPDSGGVFGEDPNLSSIFLDLPSITGAFMVAHVIGDIITGDILEAEVVVNTSPSVGGLLDSLTGGMGMGMGMSMGMGMGISARAKPVPSPVAGSATSSPAISGSLTADAPRSGSRLLDKDALQTFISTAMPFGTPLDLNYTNISAIKTNGFTSSDTPPTDGKQPAWKPYLYRGKQRMLFTIHESIHAAMYDRDEIPDDITVAGQVNCRAELEGLPDVSLPLMGVSADRVGSLSFHPCVQVPEHGADNQPVMFSPPTGNFVLLRYQAACSIGPPVKGFYQLSMVSENEGAFLFKLKLMEGYKAPLTMEYCTVTMPFPRRRLVSFNGTPSVGTVSTMDHLVEWKIIPSGRGVTGKSIEATFPGTIRFAPLQTRKPLSSGSFVGSSVDEDSDTETGSTNNTVNVEDFLEEKMNRDLPPVNLDEPFCWQAYDYAKVSFKVTGASLSGMSINPKSVSIYPAVKAPVEISHQVSSGDYILWNTLGKCPSAAVAES